MEVVRDTSVPTLFGIVFGGTFLEVGFAPDSTGGNHLLSVFTVMFAPAACKRFRTESKFVPAVGSKVSAVSRGLAVVLWSPRSRKDDGGPLRDGCRLRRSNRRGGTTRSGRGLVVASKPGALLSLTLWRLASSLLPIGGVYSQRTVRLLQTGP